MEDKKYSIEVEKEELNDGDSVTNKLNRKLTKGRISSKDAELLTKGSDGVDLP